MKPPWPENPPPGPFRATFWKSPLRGPWLTAFLGSMLFPLVVIVGATGFVSHAAYQPDLTGNAIVPVAQDLQFLIFSWPTSPSWLYALNQGLHTIIGFVAVPLLLAKLWSVIPKLFSWPPLTTPAQAIERIAIALLVGSALFEFATGVVNTQIYYPFQFNFVVAHYYGAWVFMAALFVHVAVKIPVIRRAYRMRGVLKPLRDDLAATKPERYAPNGQGLAPAEPNAPTLSRRGLVGFIGGASALTFVAIAGQSIGGPLRKLAFLAPRRESFPVNKTAAAAGITAEMTGDSWTLELVRGEEKLSFTRAELERMPQHEESLVLACVEGWTTTQTWGGVRLADLARMAGASDGQGVLVESLQPRGVLRRASLNGAQVEDTRSLLALRVNGEELPLDHGYPARIIVPALPGVHNTKWVARMVWS